LLNYKYSVCAGNTDVKMKRGIVKHNSLEIGRMQMQHRRIRFRSSRTSSKVSFMFILTFHSLVISIHFNTKVSYFNTYSLSLELLCKII